MNGANCQPVLSWTFVSLLFISIVPNVKPDTCAYKDLLVNEDHTVNAASFYQPRKTNCYHLQCDEGRFRAWCQIHLTAENPKNRRNGKPKNNDKSGVCRHHSLWFKIGDEQNEDKSYTNGICANDHNKAFNELKGNGRFFDAMGITVFFNPKGRYNSKTPNTGFFCYFKCISTSVVNKDVRQNSLVYDFTDQSTKLIVTNTREASYVEKQSEMSNMELNKNITSNINDQDGVANVP